MADEQNLPCTLAGFSISRKGNEVSVQYQHEYLKKLEKLPLDATYIAFRSAQMKLAWLADTRPDCTLEIFQMAQATEVLFEESRREQFRHSSKNVIFAVGNRVLLHFPKLKVEVLRIVGYSDSSFANNSDFSLQLQHLCFSSNVTGSVTSISLKYYKSRRATGSAMAGEVKASTDLFDVARSSKNELKPLLSKNVSLQLLTDSKSLLDAIFK